MARKRKLGRNDTCECGSGRKFKHCCERKIGNDRGARFWMLAVAGIVGAATIMIAVSVSRQDGDAAPRRVWSSEHGHYHDVQ